jgi:hypothetical protein
MNLNNAANIFQLDFLDMILKFLFQAQILNHLEMIHNFPIKKTKINLFKLKKIIITL